MCDVFVVCVPVFFSAIFPYLSCEEREARRIVRQGWERLGCASQMNEEQLPETKLALDHLDLHQ